MPVNERRRIAQKVPGWGVPALALLFIVLCFVSGILDRRVTWDLMKPGQLHGLNIVAPYQRSAGEGTGTLNSGPGLNLPAGDYPLRWTITGDGENRLRFTCSNGALLEPGEVRLEPGEAQGGCVLHVHEMAENVQILIDFLEGSTIRVEEMTLTSPPYSDHVITLALVLGVLCLIWEGIRRGADLRKAAFVLPIAFAVAYASVPSFRDNVSWVHDTIFHMARFCNLADGLAGGQFPVRCGGWSYNGYGAVTSVFYSDFFLYPGALLLLLRAQPCYVMNLYMIALNVIAAAAMYHCARRMLGDRTAAVCASILYTLAIYRVTDVYVRCALGEATAMSFQPILLEGLWELVAGDRKKWYKLSLGASAVLLSHMLSTLILAVVTVGTFVVFLPRILREKRLSGWFKAAGLSVLLCLFFLVPLLMFSMQGMGAEDIRGKPYLNAISPAQLFLWGIGDLPVDLLDKSLADIPAEPGLPALLGCVLLLMAAASGRKEQRDREALACLGAGIICLLVCTTWFPWARMSKMTNKLTDYIQFAWRFMMAAVMFLVPAAAWGYRRYLGDSRLIILSSLLLSVIMILPTTGEKVRQFDGISYGEVSTAFIQTPEYTLPGTRYEATVDRTVHITGNAELTEYSKQGTRIDCRVQAAEASVLEFPLFAFDGYRAELDGRQLEVDQGEYARLRIRLAPGDSGKLKIRYAGRGIWRLSDLVTLMTLVLLIRHILREGKKERRSHERTAC